MLKTIFQMMLIKIQYKIADFISKVFKFTRAGAKVMIIVGNKILLVEHTYTTDFMIPGGGVEKGESFHDAAIREVYEELGIKISNPKLFGIYRKEDSRDISALFLVDNFKSFPKLKIDKNEIKSAAWFDLNLLPKNTSPATKRRIAEYISKKESISGMW